MHRFLTGWEIGNEDRIEANDNNDLTVIKNTIGAVTPLCTSWISDLGANDFTF